MKALFFKEIQSFFGSLLGYLVMLVFLLLNGLFLWVFEGEYNILTSGFADLSPFFTLAPWVLLFLIPALTMKSFSDEKKQGTLELLLTKPLKIWEIVGGKFLAAFALIVLTLLPTLIYAMVVYQLGFPKGSIDLGSTLGSYFGLLFLAAAYTAIGIFTSTLSSNQIVAFLVAVFICFLFYFGFDGMAKQLDTFSDGIASLGMEYHYKSMSRGVIDTRDLVYFLCVVIVFFTATVLQLKSVKR